jgi:hypothetical protein
MRRTHRIRPCAADDKIAGNDQYADVWKRSDLFIDLDKAR